MFRAICGLIIATLPMFVMASINVCLTEKEWEERTKEIGKWIKIEEDE